MYRGSIPFTVIVADPCYAVTFSIDPSICATLSTYIIKDPLLKLNFDQSKITPSDTVAACPALQLDIETSENDQIDESVFTFD